MQQRRLPTAALLSILATVPACQAVYDAFTEPNVFCSGLTFRLTGSLQETPLDESYQPISEDPTCTTVLGVPLDLPLYVSVWEVEFEGEVVVASQSELQRLDAVMDAIEAGNGSMSPPADIQLYEDTAQTMLDQMESQCVSALTANTILCSQPSALETCHKRVVRPAEARYLDLDLGPSYERPPSFPSGSYGQGADGSCFGDDTDGDTDPGDGGVPGPGSASMSAGDGTTSGAGGGFDATGVDATGVDETGAGATAPFGDLTELVHCNRASTWCSYEAALVEGVLGSLDQFTMDDANMKLLPAGSPAYPGVLLSGLDPGEASTALAGSFGLRDGDLIVEINGTRPTSEAVAVEIVEDLMASGRATIDYKRDGVLRQVRIGPR